MMNNENYDEDDDEELGRIVHFPCVQSEEKRTKSLKVVQCDALPMRISARILAQSFRNYYKI